MKLVRPFNVSIQAADHIDPSEWVIQEWVWKDLNPQKSYVVQETADGIIWKDKRRAVPYGPQNLWTETVPMIYDPPHIKIMHPRMVMLD